MKNVLEYKGFIGSVEHSLEDEILFGKILFIDGLVTYEANGIKELKEEFQIAVDDYIEFCQEQGLNTHKSFNGKFNVRVSPELHKEATLLATKQGITLNAFVCKAIENEISATSREIPIAYTYLKQEFVELTKKINTQDFSSSNERLPKKRLTVHVNTDKVKNYVN